MWYPTRAEPPSAEPVSLPEVKRQARAEYHTDDDAYLLELITAARDHVETYCGQYFAETVVEADATDWADLARLPFGPVDEVVITYTDTEGAMQTLSDDAYDVRGDGVVLVTGYQWPAKELGSLITVSGTAGGDCPPAVKHAIRVWVASAYEVRDNEPSGGRTAFDDLLTNHRR